MTGSIKDLGFISTEFAKVSETVFAFRLFFDRGRKFMLNRTEIILGWVKSRLGKDDGNVSDQKDQKERKVALVFDPSGERMNYEEVLAK